MFPNILVLVNFAPFVYLAFVFLAAVFGMFLFGSDSHNDCALHLGGAHYPLQPSFLTYLWHLLFLLLFDRGR